MLSKKIQIKNPVGLHSRLAARFVECARAFESDVQIQKGDIYCNAKEFIKILKLSITCGTTIVLFCQGTDEEKALDTLSVYLETLEEQELS
jgi:phosphocarrier protein HPr